MTVNPRPIPPDHPLYDYAQHMMRTVDRLETMVILMFGAISLLLLKNLITLWWDVSERRLQSRRDVERNTRRAEDIAMNRELYHSVANLLASVKGRQQVEEVKREMAAKKLEESIKETKRAVEETPPKVVDALKQDPEIPIVPGSGSYKKPEGV